MKNADKPINPVLTQSPSLQNDTSLGLTKREYFSVLAMQGLLALPDKGTYSSFDEAIERICEVSVKFAEELLKQLEER